VTLIVMQTFPAAILFFIWSVYVYMFVVFYNGRLQRRISHAQQS
jgi:hypothetical protein